MSFSWARVGAILRKELRDYRRNRFVIGTMAAVPVLFIILPTIQLIAANTTNKAINLRIGLSLLYLLVIPVTMPSVVCAYSVVGDGSRTCWSSCCSRRCWQAGRFGLGSQSPLGPRMCRVAQQLSVLGSFPPLIIVALMSLNAISESTALAIGLAAALLAFDLLAWRVVAAMFDRERLATGRRG